MERCSLLVLVCAQSIPRLSWGWQTVVQVGHVEPYVLPEVVHVQGMLEQDHVQILTATTYQTPQDVVVAVMQSDASFYLKPLEDCWNEGFPKELCCSELPESKYCWNEHLYTHQRCCVMAEAVKDYLRLGQRDLHQVIDQILPRYGLNETLWNHRRLRHRHGRHKAACEVFRPSPDLQSTARVVPKGRLNDGNGLVGPWEVLASAGLASGQVFQVGVSDGMTEDPVYQLVMERGVGGLGLEAIGTAVQRARQNRPARFRVEQAYATPSSIWKWARQVDSVDAVVMDIDSFECPLLEALLDGAVFEGRQLPALLYLEINMFVPPPFKFSRGYGEFPHERKWAQQLSTTSCSLSYAIRSFGQRGYELLSFGYDTVFVRRDLTPLYTAVRPGLKFPQDEFQCFRRSRIHISSRPIRFVREWFFNARDPDDLYASLDLIWQNLTLLSDFEGMSTMPFSLFI